MIYRSSDFRVIGDFARLEDGNQIAAFRLSDVESVKTVWIPSESVWDVVVRMRSGNKLRLSFHELGTVVDRILGWMPPTS
jgi:hypothetical protein